MHLHLLRVFSIISTDLSIALDALLNAVCRLLAVWHSWVHVLDMSFINGCNVRCTTTARDSVSPSIISSVIWTSAGAGGGAREAGDGGVNCSGAGRALADDVDVLAEELSASCFTLRLFAGGSASGWRFSFACHCARRFASSPNSRLLLSVTFYFSGMTMGRDQWVFCA